MRIENSPFHISKNKVSPVKENKGPKNQQLLSDKKVNEPGKDDFSFCHWEAESQADIISTLTEKGLDEYIFTAVYPTLMHIDQNNLSGRTPCKDTAGRDS